MAASGKAGSTTSTMCSKGWAVSKPAAKQGLPRINEFFRTNSDRGPDARRVRGGLAIFPRTHIVEVERRFLSVGVKAMAKGTSVKVAKKTAAKRVAANAASRARRTELQ